MLQRKKLPRDGAAFTLIEVALAAVVLLFAIVSAFQLVVAGTSMLDLSRKQTIANQIIHAEIDQVHITDWLTVNGWAGQSRTVQVSTLSTTNVNSNNYSFGYPELMSLKNVASGFSVTRAASYVAGRSDMMTITFTVTWTAKTWAGGGTGKTYTRQGTTYAGKYGLSHTFQRS